MNKGKIKYVLLLSSFALLMTLAGTTGVSAKNIEQHPETHKQFSPIMPVITPGSENNTRALDSNDCFEVAIHGSLFTPSHYDDNQYADLYATDLTNNSLEIHPWYTRIAEDGAFTRTFSVCGVSSSLNLVTFIAVDDNTGVSSNPLPVAITPFSL